MAETPSVVIVTDSTADLPAEMARTHGIHVAPLTVNFGNEGFRDGIDLSSAQFWAKLKSAPALPTTSQVSIGQFEMLYRPLVEAGHSIVSIHLSGGLSGTVRSAEAAAGMFPAGRITVIDSLVASMALGWLAVLAAEQAAGGASAEAVAAAVRERIPRAGVFLSPDTLENLRRGGRIGRASALVGTLLNIKPIMFLRDGVVTPLERVRTRQKALQRMAELAREQGPFERVTVAHANDPAAAATLIELLGPYRPVMEPAANEIGPVIGTHIGEGGFGIAYISAHDPAPRS